MNKIKIIAAMLLIAGGITVTTLAFTDSDAKKISAISKKMAEVTEDISLSELKKSQLVTERDLLNEKIALVENHITERGNDINAYKKEIGEIVGFQKTEK